MEFARRVRWLFAAGVTMLVVVFVVLSLAVTVTLAIAACGLLLTLVSLTAAGYGLAGARPFEPRPVIELELELAGSALALRKHRAPSIDRDAIVQEQRGLALRTIPPPPAPRSSPAFGPSFSSQTFDSFKAPEFSQRSQARFDELLAAYEAELVVWLKEAEAAVWRRHSAFEVRVVMRNTAKRAAARELQVNLDLSPRIRGRRQEFKLDTPPRRPSWDDLAPLSGVGLVFPSVPELESPASGLPAGRDLPGGSGRRFSPQLQPLLHAGQEDASAWYDLELIEPGRHSITGEARGAGIDAVGQTAVIECGNNNTEPLAALTDVLSEIGLSS